MNALDLMAALVLEDGRRWGEVAVDWQWSDAQAVLSDVGCPYHFVTRARGGAKTADAAGWALAAMLADLPSGSRLYGLAADRDQGRLLLDSIEGYSRRTPELRGALDVGAYRATATRSGSVLEIVPADAPSAWGLRPAFVVVDELAQWATTIGPRRLFEAVTSAVTKIPGARLAIITTAGDPAHWSRKVLDHALRDPLWRVQEVAGAAPWLDPARLAEQRRRLPESSWRRLFENEWTSAEDRLASADDLRACVTLDGSLLPEPGRGYVIGLDVGLKRDRTVAVICHADPVLHRPEGEVEDVTVGARVTLDRIETWQGTRREPVRLADVEEWIVEAAGAYNAAELVIDPWQAVGTAQRLRTRGLSVEEYPFTSSSVGRLASTLHLLIRSRALALPDDEALLSELANVRLRETSPGIVRLDHDAGGHDDRAVALALAAHRLVSEARYSSPGSLQAAVGWHGESLASATDDYLTDGLSGLSATLPAIRDGFSF